MFRGLKDYLSSPPILVAPRDGEELLLYISATLQVVRAVLVVEREEEGPRNKGSEPGEQKEPEGENPET